jgi:hypothetical protein
VSLAAAVLAAMGGARLERTLASVGWARERIVVDPAARLDGRSLPADVRHVVRPAGPAELGSAEWLLLLLEGEVARPGLGDALEQALGEARGPRAFGVAVELQALGARWTPRRPPVRVAARATARLVVRDGRPELARRGAILAGAFPGIVAEPPASLEDAVQALDAECGALAAWLGGSVHVGVGQLVLPPLATVVRTLAAGGRSVRPWARWVAAVFAGYRALLVPAKVWELRQRAAIAPVPLADAGVRGAGA